jgi:dTDP-L-rhamnose 4-epimerase
MRRRYLITGGAGFIGTRLVARLESLGDVCVFDCLHPQVHGENASEPSLPSGAVFVRGDVRDAEALARAFREFSPTVVFHLAAETGTGQSFDEVSRYCEANVTGTARLIEAMRAQGAGVERVVLASSRAVYGEGPYRFPDGSIRLASARSPARMANGDFSIRAPGGEVVSPVPSAARHGVAPSSVYGATKLMQEYLLQQTASVAAWSTAVLRLQNVYGPGQSLRNPYTGVLSIFCSQLLAGQGIEVFEDGEITRDFVFVDDVVEALIQAADPARAASEAAIDIGSGEPGTILAAARKLAANLGRDASVVSVSGRFRPGDIRAASADITEAERVLGWRPRVSLDSGLRQLAQWSAATAQGEHGKRGVR